MNDQNIALADEIDLNRIAQICRTQRKSEEVIWGMYRYRRDKLNENMDRATGALHAMQQIGDELLLELGESILLYRYLEKKFETQK